MAWNCIDGFALAALVRRLKRLSAATGTHLQDWWLDCHGNGDATAVSYVEEGETGTPARVLLYSPQGDGKTDQVGRFLEDVAISYTQDRADAYKTGGAELERVLTRDAEAAEKRRG